MSEEFLLPSEFPVDAIKRMTALLIGGASIDIPRQAKDAMHILCYVQGATLGDPDRPIGYGSCDEYRAELEEFAYALEGHTEGYSRAGLKDWALDKLLRNIMANLIAKLQEWLASFE